MTSTDRNFVADKKQEYEQYLIWKNLPRDMTSETFEGLGITDELILELSKIRTQKDLAEHLGVAQRTITDWNKKPVPEEYQHLDWRYWAKQATKSVTSAMLRELRKHGDAPRFTAWMKYVEQAEEKQAITIDTTTELFDQIKAIAETIKDDTET